MRCYKWELEHMHRLTTRNPTLYFAKIRLLNIVANYHCSKYMGLTMPAMTFQNLFSRLIVKNQTFPFLSEQAPENVFISKDYFCLLYDSPSYSVAFRCTYAQERGTAFSSDASSKTMAASCFRSSSTRSPKHHIFEPKSISYV